MPQEDGEEEMEVEIGEFVWRLCEGEGGGKEREGKGGGVVVSPREEERERADLSACFSASELVSVLIYRAPAEQGIDGSVVIRDAERDIEPDEGELELLSFPFLPFLLPSLFFPSTDPSPHRFLLSPRSYL